MTTKTNMENRKATEVSTQTGKTRKRTTKSAKPSGDTRSATRHCVGARRVPPRRQRQRTHKPATPRTQPLPASYLTGRGGEEAAKAYLAAKGYTILETNYRVGHREIDLIAQHENRLVFVEVKTRAQNCLVLPQDAVHRLKQWHLLRAAHAYILRTHSTLEARFDIVCVKKTVDGRLEVTEHIENAFRPV